MKMATVNFVHTLLLFSNCFSISKCTESTRHLSSQHHSTSLRDIHNADCLNKFKKKKGLGEKAASNKMEMIEVAVEKFGELTDRVS